MQALAPMIATDRSELATIGVLDDLGLTNPAVVYNGAGVWCPLKRDFLEERVLSDRTLGRAVDYGLSHGLLTVSMAAGEKRALAPRGEVERLALREMKGLEFVEGRAALLGRRASGHDGRPHSPKTALRSLLSARFATEPTDKTRSSEVISR